jgi:hypothetical protein
MAHGAADVNGSPQAFLRAAIPSDPDCHWRDVKTLVLRQAPWCSASEAVPTKSRGDFMGWLDTR